MSEPPISLTTYTYPMSAFGIRSLHVGQLTREIENSSIHPGKYLNRVFNNQQTGTVEITFERPLGPTQILELDNIILLHDAEAEEALGGTTWMLSDEKSTGTHGGSADEKTWMQRTLNTISGSSNESCTLANNQFSLKQGEYIIEAQVPAYSVPSHLARIYNATKSTVAATGGSEHIIQRDFWKNYTATQTFASVACVVVVGENEEEVFEIQHYCSDSHNTSGLGRASGVANTQEVYTTVQVQKIA